MHVNRHDKESMTSRYRRLTPIQLCWIFVHWCHWCFLEGVHYFAPPINPAIITARAISWYFFIWMTTARKPATPWYRGVLLENMSLLVNETMNPHYIDCSRSVPATNGGLNESRLGGASSGIALSPFVAGIELPHQDIVDSYKNAHVSIISITIHSQAILRS